MPPRLIRPGAAPERRWRPRIGRAIGAGSSARCSRRSCRAPASWSMRAGGSPCSSPCPRSPWSGSPCWSPGSCRSPAARPGPRAEHDRGPPDRQRGGLRLADPGRRPGILRPALRLAAEPRRGRRTGRDLRGHGHPAPVRRLGGVGRDERVLLDLLECVGHGRRGRRPERPAAGLGRPNQHPAGRRRFGEPGETTR